MESTEEETIRVLLSIAAVGLLLIALAIPVGMGIVAAIMERAEHSQSH